MHVTCSMRRMGLAGVIVSLARLCAAEVVVPEEVGCCGFAGDRGFTHPEVNAWALRKLRPVIERSGVKVGYSNSRTCEIGFRPVQACPTSRLSTWWMPARHLKKPPSLSFGGLFQISSS